MEAKLTFESEVGKGTILLPIDPQHFSKET
jgi:hypothetical protein